jgi:hypothetical protein
LERHTNHIVTSTPFLQPPKPKTKADVSNRQDAAMRCHLDGIAAALAEARASGGLGYGAAWPAPISVVNDNIEHLKRTKAAVRNAERPVTPVLPPPSENDALHRAAALLQRLVRGRAIQMDVLAAAEKHANLLTEVMAAQVPLHVPQPEAPVASAAALVASAAHEMLQCASCALATVVYTMYHCMHPRWHVF